MCNENPHVFEATETRHQSRSTLTAVVIVFSQRHGACTAQSTNDLPNDFNNASNVGGVTGKGRGHRGLRLGQG